MQNATASHVDRCQSSTELTRQVSLDEHRNAAWAVPTEIPAVRRPVPMRNNSLQTIGEASYMCYII
jgi:hypothetical protein